MRILIVHPGPDFSVADVYRGWAEALQELGAEVALFNSNDRLMFYCKALIDSGVKDEDGLPIVKQAMSVEDAITAAMQGLTHACYTFLARRSAVRFRVLYQARRLRGDAQA